MGPTASGKTALAMAAASRFPVELVSVDSAQVFIDMNIGTAKPDAETLARFPHHLINLITPDQRYSVAAFRSDALQKMKEITHRGRIPLLVGGTMLYFKALRDGLADLPAADYEIRREIDARAEKFGWPALHQELAALDPATAARLEPADAQRIQRALEIIKITGQPLDKLYAAQKKGSLPYRVLTLSLAPSDRSVLHQRIADRFRSMLKDGLVNEVEALRKLYPLDDGLPSMRSVGYRQAWDFLEGRIPAADLADRGIFATRQFAKRQITWLKSMNETNVLDCTVSGTKNQALEVINRYLSAPNNFPV